MSESKKTYMEESLWEVEHFLARENINRNLLDETLIDDMTYHYYKNYYYYEMDNVFALRAVVSVVLDENDIMIDGFELWIS